MKEQDIKPGNGKLGTSVGVMLGIYKDKIGEWYKSHYINEKDQYIVEKLRRDFAQQLADLNKKHRSEVQDIIGRMAILREQMNNMKITHQNEKDVLTFKTMETELRALDEIGRKKEVKRT